MSFETLGLNAPLLRAVTQAGYNTPTPIQRQTIPIALTGRDVFWRMLWMHIMRWQPAMTG